MSISEQELGAALNEIKQLIDKYVVRIGSSVGMILLVFFFTYAQFIDRAMNVFIIIEVVASILLVIVLFKIKKVSFYLVKLKLGKQSPYTDIFSRLTVADLEKSDSDLFNAMKMTQDS
ncbi:hypothetical protein MNBD_GAMMA16-1434 [hydrothermal vent metagenome]|uniref:Uncharacterized protein n=1 Tax=hydrothermal vent metagenome TaxID=652676 RepID=A0A3B0Z7S5_9ZZZZ